MLHTRLPACRDEPPPQEEAGLYEHAAELSDLPIRAERLQNSPRCYYTPQDSQQVFAVSHGTRCGSDGVHAGGLLNGWKTMKESRMSGNMYMHQTRDRK